MNEEIIKIRAEIDGVDDDILASLKRRQELIARIIKAKQAAGVEAFQPSRFREILDRLKAQCGNDENLKELVEKVWTAIHEQSVKKQQDSL